MDEADINIEEMDVDAMFDDIQLPNSPRPDSARVLFVLLEVYNKGHDLPRCPNQAPQTRAALPPKDAWNQLANQRWPFTPLGRLDLKGSLQVVTHRSDSTVAGGEPRHRTRAQVMLERAKKMKLNSDKRKRLEQDGRLAEQLRIWEQGSGGPSNSEDLGGWPATQHLAGWRWANLEML
uniref:HMG box domain-containing protein n=1 Tax=Macrostomum lignano TaxID=282301 RepID=A0A1I8JS26_9PLAT